MVAFADCRFSDRGDLLSEMYQNDSTSYLGGYGIDLVNVCLDMDLDMPEEERRLEMCKAVDDLKAIGHKEGRKEGIENVAARALRRGMRHREIQELTGLSQWRISQIARQIRLASKA